MALAALPVLTFALLTPTARAQAAVVPPFAASSPFNVAIRSAPAIDSNSRAMVARASRTGMVHANLFEYGIPIYTATASTPQRQVWCTMSWAWGACPLAASPRRIPNGAKANQGSDAVMAVLDTTTNRVDEYWQAYPSGSGWSASWGAVNPLSGSGWGGGSTGAGASRLAGVVRVAEMQAGVINHALVLQSDNVCRGTVRPPAVKTDGASTRSDCIPEGARLQLDPSINVATLAGLTRGERVVARAMQVYGAYLIDYANTSMSMSFELAADSGWSTPGSVYTQAGFGHDYYGMPHVPWASLRVLRSWNG